MCSSLQICTFWAVIFAADARWGGCQRGSIQRTCLESTHTIPAWDSSLSVASDLSVSLKIWSCNVPHS